MGGSSGQGNRPGPGNPAPRWGVIEPEGENMGRDTQKAGRGILVEVEEEGGERVLVWLR
jgi:hypothetical protein